MQDLKFWIAFSKTNIIGYQKIKLMLENFSNLENAWNAPLSELKQIGFDEKTLDKHIINLRLGLEGESSLNDIDNLILRISEGMNKPKDYVEMTAHISEQKGFCKVTWCGDDQCSRKIRKETLGSLRIINDLNDDSKCIHCGQDGKYVAIFGQSY